MKISTQTRLFALLGQPVSHSLSPIFQNAGFRAAGLDAVYLTIACGSTEVLPLMRSLANSGGGGNVTVPHKETAIDGIAALPARVAALGAANTFVGTGNDLLLANTDVDGILYALDQLQAPATNWLIIGTGGSARAAAGAAAERGARIAVNSRSPERAAAFLAWCTTLGIATATAEECEVAINATPLGLSSNDSVPLRLADWPRLRIALDLVYRTEGTTPWVDIARARGLAVLDGRETLLAQGAASWSLWFPGVTPPLEVMRAALLGRMG